VSSQNCTYPEIANTVSLTLSVPSVTTFKSPCNPAVPQASVAAATAGIRIQIDIVIKKVIKIRTKINVFSFILSPKCSSI